MKKVDFNLSFAANDGAYIQVVYQLNTNGATSTGVISLRNPHSDYWCGDAEFPDEADVLHYGYELIADGRLLRGEWGGRPHKVFFNCVNSNYRMFDCWTDAPAGYYNQTSLFKLFSKGEDVIDEVPAYWYNRSVTLSLYILGLQEGDHPAVAGDIEALGCWRPEDALPMTQCAPNEWCVTFDVENVWSGNFQFKIITRRSDGGLRWEEGENRNITIPDFNASSSYRFMLPEASFGSPSLRLAGTVIPVFSLRSKNSWGVGDFGDMKLMADWLAATGQKVLQILPVNDTTVNGGDEDSYPYNCVSVFALNPLYTSMEALPLLRSAKRNEYYQKEREKLNALPAVAYASVYRLKMRYLRELFEEAGSDMLSTGSFVAFVNEQRSWLQPYALFRFLSSRLRCNIWDWKDFPYYSNDTYDRVVAAFSDAPREVEFYYFVQYILYTQLTDAHNYANSIGVALKGDIPIGVAPNGVDVWCDREQFNLSVSAGAPPDMFSADGQNWGFPTYNWAQMASDGYSWWRRRLQYMSHFFDAYRIDHILGFFRIWEIPRSAVSGMAGRFSPSMPLTRHDISYFGLEFDEAAHTRPYITADRIKTLFPRNFKAVTEKYFTPLPDGAYTFKECYRSSMAIAVSFGDDDVKLTAAAKEALLRLSSEVLFWCDGEDAFTPRISAFDTPAYTALGVSARSAYDRIYQHYFYDRHNKFWFEEGMRKLSPVLQATNMTACGEDLGMIPDCVPWVMKNLQVMSLEIERMPKIYGQPFGVPAAYPRLSVATPSTHDMSTLREWWQEEPERIQQYYNHHLGEQGRAPQQLTGALAKKIIHNHIASSSMLALFAWQDLMAMDERLRRKDFMEERINMPSNRDHVWNYRMHIDIETLMKERSFNDLLRSMIEECGR